MVTPIIKYAYNLGQGSHGALPGPASASFLQDMNYIYPWSAMVSKCNCIIRNSWFIEHVGWLQQTGAIRESCYQDGASCSVLRAAAILFCRIT